MNEINELHILVIEEGQVYSGKDKKRTEITVTKEDRKFMNKLDKLVPVTTSVDIYKSLFNEDTVYKNKYDNLLKLIDKDDVFKVSKYTCYKDAKRESLKQKYRWERCTNIKGQAITYKDDAQVDYTIENWWVTETIAKEIIKKFEEMM